MAQDLRQWVLEERVEHSKTRKLLHILRGHGLEVPKDSRTLLRTPKEVHYEDKCHGKYAYLGIQQGVNEIFRRHTALCVSLDSIDLQINVDGIPVFKSSKVAFHPILGCFSIFKPFVIALYCSKTKPYPVDEYLEDFLAELQQLTTDGFRWLGRTFPLRISAVICDAPARAFLKCIKGHSGYDACERCTIQGYRSVKGRPIL